MKKEIGIDPITGLHDLGFLIVSGLKGLFPHGCFHQQIKIKKRLTSIPTGYTLPPGATLLHIFAPNAVVEIYPNGTEAIHTDSRRYESIVDGLQVKIVPTKKNPHIRPL